MASRADLVPFVGRTQGWAGGVNARDSIATIGPDEARRLENMVLDEKGGANKRLGCSSQGPLVNFVTNPSFEANTTGWLGFGAGVIARDLTQAWAGLASLRLTAVGNGDAAYTDIAGLTSGKTYTASFYIKGDVGESHLSSVESPTGVFANYLLDDAGANSPHNGQFKRFSATFVAGGTTARLILGGSQTGAQVAYIDMVSLYLTSERIISLYTFYRGTNAPQVIAHTNEGKLYYTTDPTANPTVWTQIATGLSGTQPFSFETFNSKCYFTNGVDSYASWDGATYTAFGSAPKGRYIRLWKDTMFVGGVDATPDRVFESAAGDAETWPVASWVDIAHGDGDRITALGTDGFTLVVFKQRRHMAITDPVTLANRVVDFEKGCESHFSVIQHEGEMFFLSRRGVCQYYGDSPSRIISFKLDPVFDPTVINLGALSTAWAYTVENRVGWAIPEVGQNFPTLQIEYYPRLGPISQLGTRGLGPWAFMRMPAQVFTRWRYQANEFLYGGATAANKFYYLLAPVGTDDGVTFSGLLETGPYDFGNPIHDKFIRRIILLGRGRFFMQLRKNDLSSIAQTYTVDMVANSDTWGDENWNAGTWGPDSIIKQLKIDTDLYGRQVSFIFTDSETTVGLNLIEVGSKEYQFTAGKWGIYSAEFEGSVVGLRS